MKKKTKTQLLTGWGFDIIFDQVIDVAEQMLDNPNLDDPNHPIIQYLRYTIPILKIMEHDFYEGAGTQEDRVKIWTKFHTEYPKLYNEVITAIAENYHLFTY